MKVDNITLMMFVLNFVEFCFILELIYSSDFHEGRQYVTGSEKRYIVAHTMIFLYKRFCSKTRNIFYSLKKFIFFA